MNYTVTETIEYTIRAKSKKDAQAIYDDMPTPVVAMPDGRELGNVEIVDSVIQPEGGY